MAKIVKEEGYIPEELGIINPTKKFIQKNIFEYKVKSNGGNVMDLYQDD